MSTSTSVTVVRVDDPTWKENIAVAGFLAGYCGSTRRSYATDLRVFSAWCHEANLTLFNVRRAHLELFGRWMEETGRMRSTVARRLFTLASFYKARCSRSYGRPQGSETARREFRAGARDETMGKSSPWRPSPRTGGPPINCLSGPMM